MTIYQYTDANDNPQSVEINIAEQTLDKLLNKTWELGFINQNPGLQDENNNLYYKTTTYNDKEHRDFKNKVKVKLCDGNVKTAHIIHWCKSKNLFCITHNTFWDQPIFNDDTMSSKNEQEP